MKCPDCATSISISTKVTMTSNTLAETTEIPACVSVPLRTISGLIFWNRLFCILRGAVHGAGSLKIPEADIIMETRKGVALSYAPAQIAV